MSSDAVPAVPVSPGTPLRSNERYPGVSPWALLLFDSGKHWGFGALFLLIIVFVFGRPLMTSYIARSDKLADAEIEERKATASLVSSTAEAQTQMTLSMKEIGNRVAVLDAVPAEHARSEQMLQGIGSTTDEMESQLSLITRSLEQIVERLDKLSET